MKNFSEQEKLIGRYIEQNNTEAAVKLLFELIEQCVKEKDFARAEALREKILEVDPLALTEIVRSSEIIEEAKSESLDQSHLDIWSKFYKNLSTEESNTIFYAMKEAEYDANETIFEQNGQNTNLYFIDQGKLKIIYRHKNRETLIKMLGAGDIAGEDTFFSISFCTTSLLTLSRVKLKFLSRDILLKWKEKIPSLKRKLRDYCDKLVKVDALLKKKGEDRRSHNRFKITGNLVVQLYKSSGDPIGKAFKGELSDFSLGGLSFYIKTSKEDTARLLLGRYLNVKFILPGGHGSRELINERGTVIGVIYHLFNDYSIHVKFENMLNQQIIRDLTSL